MAEYLSDAGSTKDTPYLALTGELWGVFCEYLWGYWPYYNGTALYHVLSYLTIVTTEEHAPCGFHIWNQLAIFITDNEI